MSLEEWSGRCNVSDLEDGGRWPLVEECRQHLNDEKDKEMDSSEEPSERHTALPTLCF